MYPRVKRVRRGERTYEYLQLVEGRRDGGRVRQRVVASLGRLDELKASGQLDRWAGSWTRLDPPATGTRREVGPLLLVHDYRSGWVWWNWWTRPYRCAGGPSSPTVR
jgi:hypothetical protein